MSRAPAQPNIIIQGIPEVENILSYDVFAEQQALRQKLEKVEKAGGWSPRHGIKQYNEYASKKKHANGSDTSSQRNGLHGVKQYNDYASMQKHSNGSNPSPRSGFGSYICGAQQYEVGGTSGSGYPATRYSNYNQVNRSAPTSPSSRPVLLRGATQYNCRSSEDSAQHTIGTFVSGADTILEEDVLEDILQARFLDLSVMSLNVNHFASWPKDPDVAYNKLVSIVEANPPPDIICIQEGLCGRDVFQELGYNLVQSSRSCSQTLSQALYNDADILSDIDESYRQRYVVNEIYMRGDGSTKMNWEIVERGTEQISSEEPLAVRSVAWVQLRHVSTLDGPFVYVFNTQLSGNAIEEQLFSTAVIARARAEQVETALSAMQSKAGIKDLVIFAGDLGVNTGADKDAYEPSHFAVLAERGWTPVYGLDQVGPTSKSGHLVDHMITNRTTPATVKVFATTNQDGELPVTDTPLSDHNAVKATFSIRYEASEADRLATELDRRAMEADGRTTVSPDAVHFFIGDDVEQQMVESDLDKFKRSMFPLTVRPDPNDNSYVAECARAQCDYQDLTAETAMEQQAMDDMTSDLSEQMLELRRECAEQIRGNNDISQLMRNAHSVITAVNEDFLEKSAALYDELEDAESRTQTREMEMNAEISDVKNRILEAEQQLEDMETGRYALRRHMESIDESLEGFRKDIEEERKMTREIKEVGDKNFRERSEKDAELKRSLQKELQIIDDEFQVLSASEQELSRLEGEVREKDPQLAETEASVEKECSEFKVRVDAWRAECAEKQEEFTNNEERINSQLAEVQEFQTNRPIFEEMVQKSYEKLRQYQDDKQMITREIADLEQQLLMIRENTKEYESRHLEFKGKGKGKGKLSAEELQSELAGLVEQIKAEEARRYDLCELDTSPPRGGLCACFFPPRRSRPAPPPPAPLPPPAPPAAPKKDLRVEASRPEDDWM